MELGFCHQAQVSSNAFCVILVLVVFQLNMKSSARWLSFVSPFEYVIPHWSHSFCFFGETLDISKNHYVVTVWNAYTSGITISYYCPSGSSRRVCSRALAAGRLAQEQIFSGEWYICFAHMWVYLFCTHVPPQSSHQFWSVSEWLCGMCCVFKILCRCWTHWIVQSCINHNI